DGAHQIDHVPPVQPDIAQLPVGHDVGALAGFGLNLDGSGVGIHGNGFREAADFEQDVAHADFRGDGQRDVAVLFFLETGRFDGEGVDSRRQLDKNEIADSVGLGLLPQSLGLVDDAHGGSGNNAAFAVFYRTA